MTNISKGNDYDDGSVIDAMGSISIAAAATPDNSTSELSTAKEHEDDHADEDISLSYLRTMIGFRDSVHAYQKQTFLKVYSSDITKEYCNSSPGDYTACSISGVQTRVNRRNTRFNDVILSMDMAYAKLDHAIQACTSALSHDVKLRAIKEHEEYFRRTMDSVAISFDQAKFVLDPSAYLDKFVPWLAQDEEFPHTTWCSYLQSHASPLVAYATKEISSTSDWDTAKETLIRMFALKVPMWEVEKHRNFVSEMDSWKDIRAHLESLYAGKDTKCYGCVVSSSYSHSCAGRNEYVAKYYHISFINAITNRFQQELIVKLLSSYQPSTLDAYDFSQLS